MADTTKVGELSKAGAPSIEVLRPIDPRLKRLFKGILTRKQAEIIRARR